MTMGKSKVFDRAEALVLQSKYNFNASESFVKDLSRFLASYGTFESIVVGHVDNGDSLTLTFSVKKFKNVISPKV